MMSALGGLSEKEAGAAQVRYGSVPNTRAARRVLESIPDIGSATNENNSSRLRFATGLQLCFFRPLCRNLTKVMAIPTN
jgi:hypothetical protein